MPSEMSSEELERWFKKGAAHFGSVSGIIEFACKDPLTGIVRCGFPNCNNQAQKQKKSQKDGRQLWRHIWFGGVYIPSCAPHYEQQSGNYRKSRAIKKFKKDYCENWHGQLYNFPCIWSEGIKKTCDKRLLHQDHKDGNHKNNYSENIATACAFCHGRKTIYNKDNMAKIVVPNNTIQSFMKRT